MTQRNSIPIQIILLSLLVFILTPECLYAASPSFPIGKNVKNTVLKTSDGMILVGSIEDYNDQIVTLKTPYGQVIVPLNEIVRIDGDRFDREIGIIREHTLFINLTGDVTFDYTIPVSTRPADGKINILVIGSVLQIEDTDGNPLTFLARAMDGYTRCQVDVPEHRLPALLIRVLRKGEAKIVNGVVHYAYHYTPRNDQTFRLDITIPKNATDVVFSPDDGIRQNETVSWEKRLNRQEKMDFEISYRLE